MIFCSFFDILSAISKCKRRKSLSLSGLRFLTVFHNFSGFEISHMTIIIVKRSLCLSGNEYNVAYCIASSHWSSVFSNPKASHPSLYASLIWSLIFLNYSNDMGPFIVSAHINVPCCWHVQYKYDQVHLWI